jgi:hypothetical protein
MPTLPVKQIDRILATNYFSQSKIYVQPQIWFPLLEKNALISPDNRIITCLKCEILIENIGDFARLGYDAITGHTGDCSFHIQGRCLKIKKWKQHILPKRCNLPTKL